jgi:hypothetical protein
MKRAFVVGSVFLFVTLGCVAGDMIVNSTADSGQGTLRWALQSARVGDVIRFDPTVFSPSDPATILPRSELPPIEAGRVTIDASNAGVVIDGSRVPGGWNSGLQIYSSGNTIKGLLVVNFKGAGIAICGQIEGNTIGGDRSVGDGPLGEGNMFSGNAIGIDLCAPGNAKNQIVGNLIGTDVSGRNPWPNRQEGIWVEEGVSETTIGPNNTIAFNAGWGIHIDGPHAFSNSITRNRIHSNTGAGIYLCCGANKGIVPPAITSVNLVQGTVMGSAVPGSSIEVFSDSADQGALYEGTAIADSSGIWVFVKGTSIQGPQVTATVTDRHGNTSSFSRSVADASAGATLQQGTAASPVPLLIKTARELADNRIWTGWPITEPICGGAKDYVYREVTLTGDQHVEVDLNGEFEIIRWDVPEFEVHPCQLEELEIIATNDVDLSIIMRFWDKEGHARGEELPSPRFKTEDQILGYLDYVRFIVSTLKGLADSYVIWAEPTIRDSIQWIEAEDYITLLGQTIPVIRDEHPSARIVTAPTDYLIFPYAQDFLFKLLQSNLMPLVDVISWHPMYGTSPAREFHRQYYYEYPELVRCIKRTAEQSGFQGSYFAHELSWGTEGAADAGIFDPTVGFPILYTQVEAAKYLARAMVLHLGMGVAAGHPAGMSSQMPLSYAVVQNLCTVMAAHEAIDLPVKIDTAYEPVAYCAFRYPNGDRMLAVWNDGIAKDEDSGVPTTITFPGISAASVSGTDVFHGFVQQLAFKIDGNDTIVRGLLVKDYPVLIRLSDVTFAPEYEETVGDGLHRIGDIDGLESSTGSSDRDGDGVPDEKDLCPDWPGSAETSGC